MVEHPMNKWDDLGGKNGPTPIFGSTPIYWKAACLIPSQIWVPQIMIPTANLGMFFFSEWRDFPEVEISPLIRFFFVKTLL